MLEFVDLVTIVLPILFSHAMIIQWLQISSYMKGDMIAWDEIFN